jgi:hypothetical protein
MFNEKSLDIVIKENGIEQTQAQFLVSKFVPFFKSLDSIIDNAKAINVTDITQTEEMSKAREFRLQLKDIRVEAEKTRKQLKERSLNESNAIDGIARMLKEQLVPLEATLESQEKFAERYEEERKAKVEAERGLELSKYVEDITLYNYKELSPEAFSALLVAVKKSYEQKIEESRKEELLKIENEKKYSLWEKRRFELAQYKFFFGATEKTLTIESTEDEFQYLLKFFAKTKKEFDEEQEAKEIENKKLKDEAIQKEKERQLEKKIEVAKLKKIEDEKKKLEDEKLQKEKDARIEQEKKDRLEREAKLAPEKDKLLGYAELIRTIKAPEGLSKAGLEIVKEVEQKLLAISQDIKLQIKQL